MQDNITCECGSVIQKKNYNKHKLTQKHINGAGLMDMIKSGVSSVKGMFTKRESFNNVSTRTLKEYGDKQIVKLQIARQPVVKMLDSVINVLSLGKWGDLKKEYGFDQLMHLGLIVTVQLASGGTKDVMVEKVDAVTISPSVTMNSR
jgi:nitrogen regulatory protein PII